MRYVFTGLVILASVLAAQQYRCDWSVVGIGGGEMSSSAYRCGSTVGQTAAGLMTATNYWGLIGYWLPEGQVGVREQAQLPSGPALVTRLYGPQPNPARSLITIRYSLAAEGPVTVRVHDLAGRVVRTLAAGAFRPGRYTARWNGADDRGRLLANGIYFCRLTAGGFRATEKLVLQR